MEKAGCIVRSKAMFMESLLPFLNTVSWTLSHTRPQEPHTCQGPSFGRLASKSLRAVLEQGDGLDDGLHIGDGIVVALACHANEPDDVPGSTRKNLKVSKYMTIHNLLMRAYEADGKLYADEAVQYLLEDLPARVSASRLSSNSDDVIELLLKSVTPSLLISKIWN